MSYNPLLPVTAVGPSRICTVFRYLNDLGRYHTDTAGKVDITSAAKMSNVIRGLNEPWINGRQTHGIHDPGASIVPVIQSAGLSLLNPGKGGGIKA